MVRYELYLIVGSDTPKITINRKLNEKWKLLKFRKRTRSEKQNETRSKFKMINKIIFLLLLYSPKASRLT